MDAPSGTVRHRELQSPPGGRNSTCQNWLSRLDLHQDRRGQNPVCCCYTTRQELVEPEVVATSPNRIKSPVPVCCGFSSRKLVLAAGVAPALATFSTSCLFCW